MSDSTLYDADILEWSERQASALRELARQRPELSNVIDWENVAEEIEDVGRSQFNAVRSYIRQILNHIIKALSVANPGSLSHWHKEARIFHGNMMDRIAPSMVPRVDIEVLWHRALKDAEVEMAEYGRSILQDLPRQCPLTAVEIANPEFDFLRAVERIQTRMRSEKQ
jgi:hypothetical protein